jgi:hypothetical protein
MADNVTLPASSGTFDARSNDKGGKQIQVINLDIGDDTTESIVSASNPMPVALDSTSLAALETIEIGATSLAALETTELGATSLAALENITANVTGVATEAKQDTLIGHVDGIEAALAPLATETTLTALEALLTTLNTTIGASNAAYVPGSAGQLLLARRRDTDTSPAADGDLTILNLDEEGRLKVATKPASYPDITGDITAIQATIGTPVAGGTVEGDVSRASNIMALCSGTFSTVNCTFEGSLESTGNTNWFGIQAVRSNANTIETATGNLSAQPVYGWEMSVNALKRVRVRATARTSGTQSWRFVQGTYATEPIPAAQATATQAVSGTVTATVSPPVPATPYFKNSTADTNGALILTGTSGLQAFYATNEGASAAYVKLYNKATAPTVGTDVPEMTFPIPAAVGGVPGFFTLPIGYSGFRFPLGLGISITRNAAHTDTTAVGAGEVKVKLSRTV